jgi:predicted permease
MLATIINVVAPVFIVVGAGYLAAKFNLLAGGMVDGLNRFAILFVFEHLFNLTS